MLRVKWLKGTDDLSDAYNVRFQVFVKEQNVPIQQMDDTENCTTYSSLPE